MSLFGRKRKDMERYTNERMTFQKAVKVANYRPIPNYDSSEYADFRKNYKKYLAVMISNLALDDQSCKEGLVLHSLLDAMTSNEKISCKAPQHIKHLEVIDHHVDIYKGAIEGLQQDKAHLEMDLADYEKELEEYRQLKNDLRLKERKYENKRTHRI